LKFGLYAAVESQPQSIGLVITNLQNEIFNLPYLYKKKLC